MIRALIIEDVKNTADLLNEMLAGLFSDVEVIGHAKTIDEAVNYLHKEKPNLVFLDINLNEESGFDILKKTNPDEYEIIITTAHSEHAIKAIKSSAIDYLLKPYDFEELRKAVEKAKKQLELKSVSGHMKVVNKKILEKISIPTLEGVLFLEVENILFIKADSGYSEFVKKDGTKLVASKRLNAYEDILQSKNFLRVHKSYIVNLEFVKKYQKGRSGSITMIDGTIIPVAANRKQELLERLGI